MKRRILALRSNAALPLTSVAIDGSSVGLYSKVQSRSYVTTGVLEICGMDIGTEYMVEHGHDAYGIGDLRNRGRSHLTTTIQVIPFPDRNVIRASNGWTQFNRRFMTSRSGNGIR